MSESVQEHRYAPHDIFVAAKEEMIHLARVGTPLSEKYLRDRVHDPRDILNQFYDAYPSELSWKPFKSLTKWHRMAEIEREDTHGLIDLITTLIRYSSWKKQSERTFLLGLLAVCEREGTTAFVCSERTLCQYTTLDRTTTRSRAKEAHAKKWIKIKKSEKSTTILQGSTRSGTVSILDASRSTTLKGSSLYCLDLPRIVHDLLEGLTDEARSLLQLRPDMRYVHQLAAVRAQGKRDEKGLGKISPSYSSSFNLMDEVLEIENKESGRNGRKFAAHGFAQGSGLNQQVFELVHLHGLVPGEVSKLLSMSARSARHSVASLKGILEKVKETAKKVAKRLFWYQQEQKSARALLLSAVPAMFSRSKDKESRSESTVPVALRNRRVKIWGDCVCVGACTGECES